MTKWPRALLRCFPALLVCSLLSPAAARPQESIPEGWHPRSETLQYGVEWHMVDAGSVTVKQTRSGPGWNFDMKLESAGIVNRLYRVLDAYHAGMSDRFCANNVFFDAQEGKKHTQTRLNFDHARHEVSFEERNLVRNTSEKRDLDIQPCTYDIIGSLVVLRTAPPVVGKAVTLPVTDGRKFAMVRIENLGKEKLQITGKTYPTVRYEGFVFDNILYKRRGRLFIWLTDDSDHIPVRFQIHTGFPIGNINVELTKRDLGS